MRSTGLLLLVVAACSGGSAATGKDAPAGAPIVDANASTITASPATGVPADGMTTSAITVQVVDGAGQPIEGCTVELVVTGTGNALGPVASTDVTGRTIGMLSSTTPEVKTVTASAACGGDAPVALAAAAQIGFAAGPVTQLVFLVQPQDLVAGVAFAPAIKIAAEDAQGHIASDASGQVSIELASNSKGVIASGVKTVALANGVATFDALTVLVPGQDYQLDAASMLVATGATSTAFNVVYGPPSQNMSTLTLVPASAPADGITAIAAEATIRNAGGVAIPSLDVAFQISGSGGDVFPTHGVTDANGSVAASVTSLVAENKTVTATTGATMLTAIAQFTTPPCTPLFPEAPLIVQTANPIDLAAADFDGDGHVDVAVLHAADVAIYRGVGNAALHVPVAYTTSGGNIAVTTGDWNGDGHPDLAIATTSQLVVMLNAGDGQLAISTTVPLSAAPRAIAAGDLDRDNRLDLVIRTDASVLVLHGNADGSFATPVAYATGLTSSNASARIAVLDVDHDTLRDVITIGSNGYLSVFLGNGDGTLRTVSNTQIFIYSSGPIAIGDFNEDMNVDLVVPDSTGLYPVFGNGDGTFSAAAAVSSFTMRDAGTADFNGDGHLDVVAAGGSTPELRLFLGNGNGTFQTPTVYALMTVTPSLLGGIDLDSDGHPDVVLGIGTASPGPRALAVLRGNALGHLDGNAYEGDVPGPTRAWFASTVGDFDGSGTVDLFAQNAVTQAWGAQLTAADGTITPAATVSVAGEPQLALDFDRDGKLDIVLDYGSKVRWLRGNGDGTFQLPVDSTIGTGNLGRMAAGDFNKDGILDLAIVSTIATDTLEIALGNGDGTFADGGSYIVGAAPREVVAADLDADGNLDLVVANQHSAFVSVLAGAGNGTFAPAQSVGVTGSALSLAAGDFNGDGAPDVAVSNGTTSTISILIGKGDTTFEPEVRIDIVGIALRVASADIDNNGTADIVAWGTGVTVLPGVGDGTFRSPLLYDNSGGVEATVVDFDRNGRVDILSSFSAGTGNPPGFAFLKNTGCR